MGTKVIEYQGQKKTMNQWAKDTGIPVGTLASRFKNGWAIERALSTPPLLACNGSTGKMMRTGVLESLLKVWEESGRAEFERQLKERFKDDAIKVIQSFQNMFPKELEQNTDTPKTAIQVNNYIDPKDFNSRFTPMGGQ